MPRQSDPRPAFAPATGDVEVIEFTLDEAIPELFVPRPELSGLDPVADFASVLGQPAPFAVRRGGQLARHARGHCHGSGRCKPDEAGKPFTSHPDTESDR